MQNEEIVVQFSGKQPKSSYSAIFGPYHVPAGSISQSLVLGKWSTG